MGRPDTTYSQAVTLTLEANPGEAELSGATATASNGIATFSGLRLNRSGTGYVLKAEAPARQAASSAPFDVTSSLPPPATALEFTVDPSTTQVDEPMSPDVQVAAVDGTGRTVTNFTGTINLAFGSNPGGASLSGSTSRQASNGVARFSGLSVNRTGSGYTLRASSGSLNEATSASFDITAAPPPPAVRLVFSVQPSNVQEDAAITPPVKVTAVDVNGAAVGSYSGMITVALSPNTVGGVLNGTKSVVAVNGVATFTDLKVSQPGSFYSLTASASGLLGVTSTAFNVTPAPMASRLVFTTQPTSAGTNQVITPSVQVTAVDAGGTPVATFSGTITVAIGSNPGGGTLSGTTLATAVNGVATFPGLKVDKPGNGYRLVAGAVGLSGVISEAFNINPPPQVATKIAFVVQPSATQVGDNITPSVQVAAQDAAGLTVTSYSGTITIAIGSNPGGGSLSGTTAMIAVNGVATFSTLRIDRAGNGYTLAAGAPGLTGATSVAFNITAQPPPPATKVVFQNQPTATQVGASITPAIRVAAVDAAGATVTGYGGTITISLGSNPSGGTLGGTASVAAVNGVATFANLSIDRAGNGYRLAAGAPGLTGETSAPFNVTPQPATKLAFHTQPSATQAGAAITPAVQVFAQDAAGQTVAGYSGTITITIGTNPAGGALLGTTAIVATNGVATFSDLRIDRAGNGYTLAAGAPGLTGTTSAAFNVTAPPPPPPPPAPPPPPPPSATQLSFLVQPTATQAGQAIQPAVQVAARDAAGATVVTYSGIVTIAIGVNPAAGVLSGTLSVGAVNGVATFANLRIDTPGNGYALSATAPNLTAGASTAFNVTP